MEWVDWADVGESFGGLLTPRWMILALGLVVIYLMPEGVLKPTQWLSAAKKLNPLTPSGDGVEAALSRELKRCGLNDCRRAAHIRATYEKWREWEAHGA